MKDAGFLYVVRSWVDPKAREAIMAWLDGGHVKEVVGQPGFLWCLRTDLSEAFLMRTFLFVFAGSAKPFRVSRPKALVYFIN